MDGSQPYEGREDTQEIEAVISRTYESGKMRHMAIDIGPDGWMDVCVACALLSFQGSPSSDGGVSG